MPRRRPTKARSGGKPRAVNRGDGKMNKWNKSSDVPLDEEDQFHASRDKILLDGDDIGDDDEGDDDEVFALRGIEEDDEEDEEEAEDGVEEAEMQGNVGEMSTQKKKRPKAKPKKKAAHSSPEESESEEETWGRGKAAYYSSNAAQLESDDEEGNELEEQEALRLQGKAREDMGEDDFGLNDALDIDSKEGTDEFLDPASSLVLPLPQEKKLLIRHLEKSSPETLALARDWEDTAQNLIRVREKLAKMQSDAPDNLSLGMIHLHYQALLTYTTTLAFYLHLRSTEKYARRPQLLESHPILGRLLTLKQSLTTLEDFDFAASDSEDGGDDDDDDDDESLTWDDIMVDGEQVWNVREGLDPDELNDLLKDATPASKVIAPAQEEPPKKKRRTSAQAAQKAPQPAAPTFDLVEPDFTVFKSSSSRVVPDAAGVTDAYGEVTSLQHADAADKSARKKSLRFHTSRIEGASARRQGARSRAAGGDDDLPYRERRKEKEARLAKEAKSKGMGQGGADLDDAEPERKTEEWPREDGDGGEEEADSANGYYELVKRKVKEKKEQKKAEYDALQAASRPDFAEQDDAAGPRSLTRAILANKGLTPHRPKSVRNPRVKKRQRFEKAKKKISSQQAVYKGGLADTGRYDGEKSGISKVVKSVRLG